MLACFVFVINTNHETTKTLLESLHTLDKDVEKYEYYSGKFFLEDVCSDTSYKLPFDQSCNKIM